MPESTDHQQREVYYKGMVQGVGFRYTARRVARRFAVTGFVQNLPDGRVMLVAEGTPEELDRLLSAIKVDMGHYIDEADEIVRPATGRFRQFDIRF